MAWMRKKAEVEEVITTNPGATVSGVCALCASMEGQPVSEAGSPPFHNHCACGTEMREVETQPEDIIADSLSEEFSIGTPEPAPEEDPGGVIEL